MVTIPKRGKAPFISPAQVENNDVAVITGPPYVQDAEHNRFKRERTVILIQLKRNGNDYRMGLNTTSNDRLVDAFGPEGNMWQGKEIRIVKSLSNVAGTEKPTLYVVPLTQTSIAPAEK